MQLSPVTQAKHQDIFSTIFLPSILLVENFSTNTQNQSVTLTTSTKRTVLKRHKIKLLKGGDEKALFHKLKIKLN